MSLVSIIVPIYNSEKYLRACIESLITQTYKNLEIILVNDGSTDSSLEICEYYKNEDPRILVVNKENEGVSSARNAGLDIAKGQYVSFVDSDDELYSHAITLLLRDIVSYQADVAAGLMLRVTSSEQVAPVHKEYVVTYSGREVVELALQEVSHSSCAKIFKRELLKNIRFVEGKKVNEDGFFIFECYAQCPKIVKRNTYVYKYFVRDNSASRSAFSDKYLDLFYFLNRKKEIVNKKFAEMQDELTDLEVRTHLCFLQILCRTTDKKYQALQRESVCLVKKHYHRFVSANENERRMARIVAHGLYPIYKRLVWLKYYR